MEENIKELWNKYEEWCNKNYKTNLQLFNKPVSNEKLDKLTSIVGCLNDDFKSLYSLHDGAASGQGMFFGFTFLSVDEIIEEINYMIPDNLYRGTSNPERTIKVSYYEKGWLPIAADGSGNFIGVDYVPDINGIKGQIINFGRDEHNKYVLAKNLGEFLQLLINNINNKNIINTEEGVVFYNSQGKIYHHLTDFMINIKYNI